MHILIEGIFLCIRHIQEEEDLPELSDDLRDEIKKRQLVIIYSTLSLLERFNNRNCHFKTITFQDFSVNIILYVIRIIILLGGS